MSGPAAVTRHRVQVAVDCECGTSVEACDEEELFDDLLEHIAAAHESAMEREATAMLVEIYDAGLGSSRSSVVEAARPVAPGVAMASSPAPEAAGRASSSA